MFYSIKDLFVFITKKKFLLLLLSFGVAGCFTYRSFESDNWNLMRFIKNTQTASLPIKIERYKCGKTKKAQVYIGNNNDNVYLYCPDLDELIVPNPNKRTYQIITDKAEINALLMNTRKVDFNIRHKIFQVDCSKPAYNCGVDKKSGYFFVMDRLKGLSPSIDNLLLEYAKYPNNETTDYHFVSKNDSTVNLNKIKTKSNQDKLDNQPPEILITEPEITGRIKKILKKKIKIAGRAIDSDGIYEIIVNGFETQLRDGGYFSLYIPLAVGKNTVSIKATDTKMKSSYKKFSIHRKSSIAAENEYKKEKRFALLIGNSDYIYAGKLSNSVNDARAMKRTLEDLGFTVIKYENINQKAMKKRIDAFGRKLKNYNVGLFFYAGHGLQVKGNNYLIPVDAKLENENDAEYDAVRADRVLAKMESAGSKTNIVILDACRDNPFERSWRRGTKGRGLAFMNAPSGSIIAYATSPGDTASDGTGNNGLYTSAILQHIKTPNITIEQMFKRVRSTIMDWSANQQVPWESTSLRGNFYFKSK